MPVCICLYTFAKSLLTGHNLCAIVNIIRLSLQIWCSSWCSRLIRSGEAAVHNTHAQVCFTNPQPACMQSIALLSNLPYVVLLQKQHLISLTELCQFCRIMVFICTKLFFIILSSFTFEPWISMTTLTQMIVEASTKPNEFNETLQELLIVVVFY